MKKLMSIIIVFIVFLCSNVNALNIDINSKNAVLYNLNNDKVLYEKDSSDKVSIASLTKIMTGIVAIENIDNLDEKIKITNDDYKGIFESHLATAGFNVGVEATYRDLLYGLMFPSGADAAQTLANNIAGSNDKYVSLMNKKAKELKLKNTHFANTTGLDDSNHYSTVEDVATIFKYALKNKEFKKIIETVNYKTSDGKLTFKNPIKKTSDNHKLDMNYVIGGKTGTTGDAGLCLASIAKKGKANFMLVTVRAPYPANQPFAFLDAKNIYEYFIKNYSYQKVIDKDDVIVSLKTKYIKEDKIDFKPGKDIEIYLENNYNKNKIKYKYNGKKIVTYKMKKGEHLGKVSVYYKDQLVDDIDVVLKENQSFSIIKYLWVHKVIVGSVLVLLLLIVFLITKNKKKKKKKKKYNYKF